ncbi:ABC transporter ATP-binding protein [Alteromonas sp. 14N.309.X.WAT.G.H12]|uniref:ABC transporter ATP-binding protein n=1 Tax=Alteromonas sp. 14N.309.X.WAT.G.H12 TaxID=3120824 RepID=UPI002FD18113
MLIQISNGNKNYTHERLESKVLTNTNIKINSGEFVGIIGDSGSGKTTLLNILGLLDDLTSGKYFYNGIDTSTLKNSDLDKIRNTQFGFVFQSFYLLSRLTVIENVCLPLRYCYKKKSERISLGLQILEKLNILGKSYMYPSQLSGGQIQRVAIARALVNNPSVIFADEPTGNLDSKNSFAVMKLLKKIHESGHTVIVVTHDLKLTSYFTKIFKVMDGKIIDEI